MDSEPKKALISCAKDTCSGFGGQLFKSLKNSGYPTKVASDNHQALTTEEIQRFRIFIIVLSDHYATCQFRLDKLVEIVDKFGKTKRRRIFPVFFDVIPFDVKNQKGSFEIAFDVHKNYVNADKLKKWQEALTWVGHVNGWPFKRSGNKYEHVLVKEIIEAVSEIVPCTVELDRRAEAVNGHLKFEFESDAGLRIVGIYGEAGIGKTTVAHEVYHSNSFENFDSYGFLDRVGECLKTQQLVGLINKLLLEIGDNCSDFESADEATSMSILKQHVKHKRLFLVLEDILDENQLRDIIKVLSCFGSNSKVIITAVENFFQKYPQIKLYEVERFKGNEALDLLCLKAFNSKGIPVDYLYVLLRAETIASGVPLILEVIGSNLGGEKSESSWTSILDKYENIEDDKKQGMLQMSFRDLSPYQMQILTFIATASLDEKESSKVEYLRASFEDDIKVFLGKSLIKINERDFVTMHDLIRKRLSRALSIQTISVTII